MLELGIWRDPRGGIRGEYNDDVNLRVFDHTSTQISHGTEDVGRVFQWQSLILISRLTSNSNVKQKRDISDKKTH